MTIRTKLLTLFLLLTLCATAVAKMVNGAVVYTDGTYVIFYTQMGFSVGEYYGGHYVLEKEDMVVGKLDSYGFTDVFCPKKDRSARVYIDNWMLSKEGYHKHSCDI